MDIKRAEKQYESLQERLAKIRGFNDAVVGQTGMVPTDYSNVSANLAPSEVYGAENDRVNASISSVQSLDNESNSLLDFMSKLRQQDTANAFTQRELELKEREANKGNGIADLVKLRKDMVDAGLSPALIDQQLQTMGVSPNEEVGKEGQLATQLIDELMERDLDAIFGLNRLGQYVGAGATTKAKMEQLISLLSLDARKLIKGTGQISDKETQMLKDSVAGLKPNMSAGDAKRELQKIRSILNGGVTPEEDVSSLINKYWE